MFPGKTSMEASAARKLRCQNTSDFAGPKRQFCPGADEKNYPMVCGFKAKLVSAQRAIDESKTKRARQKRSQTRFDEIALRMAQRRQSQTFMTEAATADFADLYPHYAQEIRRKCLENYAFPDDALPPALLEGQMSWSVFARQQRPMTTSTSLGALLPMPHHRPRTSTH